MKSFRFPLQRVLDWRALSLRTEEEKLGGLQHKLASFQHRENALTAAQLKSELGLLGLPSIDGSDLQALKDYRVLEKLKEKRLRTWTYLSDRELENIAAESYISNWRSMNER